MAVDSRDSEAALTCAGDPLISTVGCGTFFEFDEPTFTLPTSGNKIVIYNELSVAIRVIQTVGSLRFYYDPIDAGDSRTFFDPYGVWLVTDDGYNILPIERNNPINGEECYVIAGHVELNVHVY